MRLKFRKYIALVLLVLSFKGYAQEFYHYNNPNFDIDIQTVLINADSAYVTINIRSKSDVLIPLDICEPYQDSATLWFDNAWCPPFYIPGIRVTRKYRHLKKDSVLNVQSLGFNVKNLQAVKIKMIYIPDNPTFKELESDLSSFEQDGMKVYYIESLYESKLLQRLELLYTVKGK
jgi:hypothetical protein